MRRGLAAFIGSPPDVQLHIGDEDLRSAVLECLDRAGRETPPAGTDRHQQLRTVLVCDASHLTRGRPQGRSRCMVAVVPQGDIGEARRALAAGATGIVFAHELAALPATVAAVSEGQLVVPISLRTAITKPVLTTREKQILALVVLGFSNREIADQLFVAESTVKSHLFSAFRRLGVRTRREATALILDDKQGLGSGILAITR